MLARSMVTNVINSELADIVKNNRELTNERLEWLEEHGANMAINSYRVTSKEPYGLTYFSNKAKIYAGRYVTTIRNNKEAFVDEVRAMV
jgi:hypothetical protein